MVASLQGPPPASGVEGPRPLGHGRDKDLDRADRMALLGCHPPQDEGGSRRAHYDNAFVLGRFDIREKRPPMLRESALGVRGRRALVSSGPPLLWLLVRVADLRSSISDRTMVRPSEPAHEAVFQRHPSSVLEAVRPHLD